VISSPHVRQFPKLALSITSPYLIAIPAFKPYFPLRYPFGPGSLRLSAFFSASAARKSESRLSHRPRAKPLLLQAAAHFASLSSPAQLTSELAAPAAHRLPLRVRLLVVQAFGVIGLVIGLLVFSLLMSIIDIYKQ
jgi:hypothetical protein